MLLRDLSRTVFSYGLHKLTTVKVGQRIASSRIATWICGKGAVIANLSFGDEAVVFINEGLGRNAYLWGDNDPRISAVVLATLRKGDTALDIGANFGLPGLLIAKCVGSSGMVHLFEPQPLVASCLRTSLMLNGYSNAIVHECALSDRTGTATMTNEIPSEFSLATIALAGSNSCESSLGQKVRTEHAGEYVASLACKEVALIKIDVEGHEPTVIASMLAWLQEKRVPVIIFECHLNGQAFHENESVRLLSSLGYDFLSFDMKSYWKTHLIPVDAAERHLSRDFVAVRWQELDQDRHRALKDMIS